MNHPLLTVLLFVVAILLSCLGILVGADPRGTGGARALRLFGAAAVCVVGMALAWRL